MRRYSFLLRASSPLPLRPHRCSFVWRAAALGVLLALVLAAAHGAPHRASIPISFGISASLRSLRRWLVPASARRSQLDGVRSHPAWLLGLAMVHHPLLAGVGALFALAVAARLCARCNMCPSRAAADALAPPLALALAFEQLGALAVRSGYGTETAGAGRWSTPILLLPAGAARRSSFRFIPCRPMRRWRFLPLPSLCLCGCRIAAKRGSRRLGLMRLV